MPFSKFSESLRVWANIYRRIRFFRRMYPLSAVLKDLALFPLDYAIPGRDVKTVRNLTFAVTHKCNIRCEMCYFHKELGDRKELSTADFRKALDSAAASRPCVILSGGEPFMHPDLMDMAEYAKTKGLPLQVFSNGTLARPELVDALTGMGLDYLNLTLLGDETTHPLTARAPRSYAMFLDNLEHAAANRGSTQIILNYTVTPRSAGQMWHAVELAKRFKLDGLRFQHYNFLLPKEFAAQEKLMERLFQQPASANEIEGGLEALPDPAVFRDFLERLGAEAPGLPVQWAPTLTDAEIGGWYSQSPFRTARKCLYPWRGILVDADAKVYPCSKIYLELGDLSQGDLMSIWNGETMKRFRGRLKKGLFPACSRCCKL